MNPSEESHITPGGQRHLLILCADEFESASSDLLLSVQLPNTYFNFRNQKCGKWWRICVVSLVQKLRRIVRGKNRIFWYSTPRSNLQGNVTDPEVKRVIMDSEISVLGVIFQSASQHNSPRAQPRSDVTTKERTAQPDSRPFCSLLISVCSFIRGIL